MKTLFNFEKIESGILDAVPTHPTNPNFIAWIEKGNLIKRGPITIGSYGSVVGPSLFCLTTDQHELCYAMQLVLIADIGYGWFIGRPTPREAYFNEPKKGYLYAIHHLNLDDPYLPFFRMGESDNKPLLYHQTCI